MLPAGKRLEAGDVTGLEVDERLVEELELVLVERPAQFGLDGEATPRLARLLGLVDLGFSGLLRLLHSELGVAEQLFGFVIAAS